MLERGDHSHHPSRLSLVPSLGGATRLSRSGKAFAYYPKCKCIYRLHIPPRKQRRIFIGDGGSDNEQAGYQPRRKSRHLPLRQRFHLLQSQTSQSRRFTIRAPKPQQLHTPSPPCRHLCRHLHCPHLNLTCRMMNQQAETFQPSHLCNIQPTDRFIAAAYPAKILTNHQVASQEFALRRHRRLTSTIPRPARFASYEVTPIWWRTHSS
jgi:hypothetical protein